MEGEIKKYNKYKNGVKFFLICIGLWPKYDKYSTVFKIFLIVTCIIIGVIISSGILAFCIENAKNITLLTRGLGLGISFSLVAIKPIILTIHRKGLQNLNEGLSTYFSSDLEIPAFQPHLLKHWRKSAKLFYMFNYSVFLNAIFYLIIPLTFIRYGKYVRAYPIDVPFEYEPGGLIHWLLYALECMSGYFIWCATCGVDSLFGLYTLHLVGELKLLSYKFERLQINNNYKENLKFCVIRHIELMKAKRVLEDIFGFLAIYISVTCAIVLCTLIFQATELKSISFLKGCYLVCYVGLKLVQVYSYTWCGFIINFESQGVLNSVYNSYWTDTINLQFMNDVLIILSQKPLRFRVKGVLTLEFDIFSKVINTSVSYFFLLRTLEESFDVKNQ